MNLTELAAALTLGAMPGEFRVVHELRTAPLRFVTRLA